jgi:hypothetical protein
MKEPYTLKLVSRVAWSVAGLVITFLVGFATIGAIKRQDHSEVAVFLAILWIMAELQAARRKPAEDNPSMFNFGNPQAQSKAMAEAQQKEFMGHSVKGRQW